MGILRISRQNSWKSLKEATRYKSMVQYASRERKRYNPLSPLGSTIITTITSHWYIFCVTMSKIFQLRHYKSLSNVVNRFKSKTYCSLKGLLSLSLSRPFKKLHQFEEKLSHERWFKVSGILGNSLLKTRGYSMKLQERWPMSVYITFSLSLFLSEREKSIPIVK